MNTVALYTLASEYQAAAAQLADLDLDPATVADTLEGMSGALEVKAQNVAMFVRNLEVTESAIDDAIKKLQARKKAVAGRRESITDYLKSNMEACGMTRIDGPNLRLAIRTNPPALHIDDPAQVPDEYWMQPPLPPREIAKATLKGVLMSGQEIPGAHVAQGTRLEIKI